MEANIVKLNDLSNDEAFIQFLEELKDGATRAVFIVEKEDGSISYGSNSEHKADLICDFFRLQELCRKLVMEA
jgi:hypothetical protein